ncbi:MAG: hypothetical protein KAS23_08650 [Anaerohalosphaera sp.]|nr:hypothetical protein [Anaerohalosphaera sp.]
MTNMRLKISIIAVLCVTLVYINGCKKKIYENGVTYRPDNFPGIINSPENATDVKYESPETARPEIAEYVQGRYSLWCNIVEEYPAEKTIEQLHNDLKAQGCVKIEWKREDMGVYTKENSGTGKYELDVEETRDFQESLKEDWTLNPNGWVINEKNEFGVILHVWTDEWITPNDELIRNVLTSGYLEGNKEMMSVHLSRYLYTPSSWKYKYVLKYKELHPEEFKEAQNQKTMGEGEVVDELN